jgi:tetratricopeptide (TPR) repeat protein
MNADHEGELKVARRGRDRYPEELAVLNSEARALIGLGRVDDALEVLQQSLTLESPGYSPAGSMRLVALELRAHGFPEEAEPLLERAVQWYRSQPPERFIGFRSSLANTLFCLGRFDEAEELYRQLRDEEPDDEVHLGYLGVIAAQMGRTAEARVIDDSLAAWDVPYSRGRHTAYRAAIAAWLGEKERAVALLQQAFREGNPYGIGMHAHPALAPLWDYEPFREFLRPRG